VAGESSGIIGASMPSDPSLFEPLSGSAEFRRLVETVRAGGPASVAGLVESSKALALRLLRRETGRPILLLVPDEARLDEYASDLAAFARLFEGPGAAARIIRFPALGADPYQGIPPHFRTACERASALSAAASGGWDFLIAPARALLTPLPAPEALLALRARVRVGERLDLDRFLGAAVEGGYRPEEMLGEAGEFSRRGGIVDIFPPGAERPFRIELEGEEIASIRTFDPDTQRSIGRVESIDIPPVVEAPLGRDARERLAIAASLWRDRLPSTTESRAWADRLDRLEAGEYVPGIEGLARVFLPGAGDLMAYARGAVRVVDEPDRTGEEVLSAVAEAESSRKSSPGCPLPPAGEIFLEPDAIRAQLRRADLRLTELRIAGEAALTFATQPSRNHGGRVLDFLREIAGHRVAGRRLVVFMSTRGTRERLGDIFRDYAVTYRTEGMETLPAPPTAPMGRAGTGRGIVREMRAGDGEIDPDLVVARFAPGDEAERADRPARGESPGGRAGPPTGPGEATDRWGGAPAIEIPPGDPVVLVECHLSHGFVMTELGLAVATEREIFGEEPRPAAAKRRKGAAFISDFRDLRPGDLVVHVDHGVGRYLGLSRPPGSPRDFMLLQYSDDARLYVPVDRLDLVQKFGGAEGESRALDKLGGPGWERVKTRVRKAIRDMTKELLDLYAKRKAIPGRAFSPDTPWQREFEDAFPYTLTPDQERAIADVKADLESDRPMERLLCGDVGYGKTEVAMRAAFKVVQDGAQVAVLAPTTVLAFQHWNTFRERFAAFPVTVEMISRLRTPREQKEVLARLADGKVDILIGTHRILSKDVRFRDLGLLVVDEEQRFGVAHKERLKQMSAGIDTLAMSATPIPRTLQMSLAGVRDLSVIETPPMNRLAIQTNLVPYNRGTVAAAIRGELRRGGQIYFVHNRIQSIHRIAAKIQELVPEARLAVTHGQLDARALEESMVRFLRRDFDILVSTTIIENGLDIPNVNTLVVNRADRFGLSQLYQLRGRVGRSDVRAYAYFIVPSRRTLTPIARRRLLALQEFSDLGAGFRIAALDLELRGAGELLGARQHGHIAALGFDLFLKMLEEAVREYQGEAPAPEAATFNLGVDIRLPDAYIPEPNLRLALYKRIASAAGDEELAEIRAEIEDRYGTLPAPGENLFAVAGLKIEAGRLGVKSVEFGEGRLAFRFQDRPVVSPDRVISFLGRQGSATLTPTGILKVPAPAAAPARIEAARVVLKALAS